MVLRKQRRSRILGALAWACAVAPGVAWAQDLPPLAPALNLPDDVFAPTPIPIGGATLEAGGSLRTEYDDNIYAQATDPVDDLKIIANPFVNLRASTGAFELAGHAEGNFRQYVSHGTESASGGEVSTSIAWAPSASDRLVLLSAWRHLIEDRGEPEARVITSIGPREIDNLSGDLSYAHQGPRLGFQLRGTADRFRYVDDIDRNRNLDSYGLAARGTYRVGPLINAFVESFVNRRDFLMSGGEFELDRDATTYGARIGAAIDPGGLIHGDAAIGVYRFDPTDPRIVGRTGVSAQAQLTYNPTPRIAVTLEGFAGNAATFRTGAQSREDRRVRLGVQQEVRHNLRWQASVLYRQSRYFGTGITEDTYAATFEVDYLVNRRLVLAGTVRYADRESTVPLEEYKRLRIGLDLRFQL